MGAIWTMLYRLLTKRCRLCGCKLRKLKKGYKCRKCESKLNVYFRMGGIHF